MSGFFKYSALVAVIYAGVSANAFADPTQININGVVTAAACTVESGATPVNVPLDPIAATDMTTAGQSGAWKTFSLKLINCPASTTISTATFSGNPAVSDATKYANTGTASNIEIELQNAVNSAVLSNGQTYATNVDSATHQAVYNLQARAYTAEGGVMPGTIVGTVQASFTYQ